MMKRNFSDCGRHRSRFGFHGHGGVTEGRPWLLGGSDQGVGIAGRLGLAFLALQETLDTLGKLVQDSVHNKHRLSLSWEPLPLGKQHCPTGTGRQWRPNRRNPYRG